MVEFIKNKIVTDLMLHSYLKFYYECIICYLSLILNVSMAIFKKLVTV